VTSLETKIELKGRYNRSGWSALIDMKEKVIRQKAKVVSPLERILKLGAALFTFAFCLFPFALSSPAHEPITTKVRFNKELIRIFQRNCLSCHRPGGIAFSLATYDEARPWAKAIKEEVLEKRMPPWRAVKGYGDFSNAPSLTQRDVDLIVNWVEGGAPKGDDKDLPAGPLYSTDWQLGKPDLIFKADAESKITAGADEYRTFVFPTNFREERWVRAIDLLPGNASVVHCATVFISTEEASSGPEKTMPREPIVVLGRSKPILINPSFLATWLPGQKTITLGEGLGFLIPAHSRVMAQIHYRGTSEAATDRTSIGVYFAKNTSKTIREFAFFSPERISPMTSYPNPIRLTLPIQSDTEAIAIRPQVVPLIISLQATAYRPDGSQEVLIWTRGYQFDWKPTYYFKKPVALPKGTRVEVIVYLDNSDENQDNAGIPAKPAILSELSNAEDLCALLVVNTNPNPASITKR